MPTSLRADQLKTHYGDVLRSFGDLGARILKNKLKERYPSVEVGDQALRTWIQNHRVDGGHASASAAPASKRARLASEPSAAASSSGSVAVAPVPLTAASLEAQYGAELRAEPFAGLSPYLLEKKQKERIPPVHATQGVLRKWVQDYRKAGVSIESVESLEQQYGDTIRARPWEERKSAFKLMNFVLAKLQPSVSISEPIAKAWLKLHGGLVELKLVQSAGHLEMWCGARIREDAEARSLGSEALAAWLEASLSVKASVITCQTWLTKDWSSSGKLLSPQDVERELGQKLRLAQYEERFGEEVVTGLVEELAEQQPPVCVTGHLLREWYFLYLLKSGPLLCETAQALNDILDEEARAKYAGLGRRDLETSLAKRLRPVRASGQVCRTWLEQFAKPEPAPKRARVATKRDVAASAVELQPLESLEAVERACGQRFRDEVCHFGLDRGKRAMRQKLLSWGCGASQEACRLWLDKYRLGVVSVDGGGDVYVV